MAKSYYELLDISADAKDPEIRRAYRSVLRKYHPDLHPNQRKAAKRSRQLNAALGVLTNRAERARYDAKLKRIEKRKKRAEEKSKRRNSKSHKTDPNQKRKSSSRKTSHRQPGPRPGFKQRSANGSTKHSTKKTRRQPQAPKWEKKPEWKRTRKKAGNTSWSRRAKPFRHSPKPDLDYQHGLAIGLFVGAVLIILLLALLVALGLVELKMLLHR